MNIHQAQANWESRTMSSYQREIDDADRFEQECDQLEDCLWDDTAEEIYERLERLGRKGSGAAAELRSAISCAAATILKNERGDV